MKNKVIKILKDESLSQPERYNQLLDLLAKKRGVFAIRAFQTSYNQFKYDSIIHEVKKAYEVTDLDIHNFNTDEEIHEEKKPAAPGVGEGSENRNEAQAAQTSAENAELLEALKGNPQASEGLKIRDEYPFLNDSNTPDEYKVLVSDKITAWKDFAKNHADLSLILGVDLDDETLEDKAKEQAKAEFEALSEDEKEERIYLLAKAAVKEFQLNADIKKELDHYRETGKVLGKHPKLNDLRIKQEISELTEAELVEMKTKAQKNASKAEGEIEKDGTNEAREKRVSDWRLREKLAVERLKKDFPKKK